MSEPHPAVGAVLEQDHQRIDGHLDAFARSLDDGAADDAAFMAGSAALRHHIYVEEAHHFPALRAAGLLGPILVMLREHGEIWDLLDQLERGLGAGAPASDLAGTWQRLERVLAEHNAKEERILYPAGDQALTEAVAAEVLAALASGSTPPGWICEMAHRG
jgi:iron-sulfur cluster repair protein YtfE (RIC family)